MKRFTLSVGVLLLLFTRFSEANQDNFSWHGFVAQGLTSSTDSNYITTGNEITTELTEIGINGSYVINPSLSVSGQLVYLDGGNRFRRGARLDYLFLDWRLTRLFDWQVNVHLGDRKSVV